MQKPWHAQSADAVLAEWGTDPARGLERAVASGRLGTFGPNRIETGARDPWYRVLLRQFSDVLIAILAVAAAVSLAIGEVLDALAILAILLANGVLGFVQEWRAERALLALQKMLSQRCVVVRQGLETEVEAESLVPGDLVVLSSGDRVPADLRIFEQRGLEMDESALTGESLAVHKQSEPVELERTLAGRAPMAWTGTVVTSGRGRGVVVATGMSTEFGRIAELTRAVRREATPLQHKLAVLGRQLGMLALLAAALVAVTGWLFGRGALEMFMTGVSLAVAVVPEGLPAVVTVTLALGVRQMVRRRALPRRLQATETLGSATVILTDKTGTLTENQMTVARLWMPAGEVAVTGTGYAPEGTFETDGQALDPLRRPDLGALLEAGMACNDARIVLLNGTWERIGEPTEAALVVAATKAGISGSGAHRVAEFAFDSTRKRMTVLVEDQQALLAYTKGAPEVLIERCSRILDGGTERPASESDRELASAAYRRLARGGMRTLALARRSVGLDEVIEADSVERDLTLLGIAGILDPPRPEVSEAVARARSAGVRVLMVTGDAPETARAIAETIGLPVERTLDGRELDALDDRQLRGALADQVLFARVSPEHKLRIARQLERAGHVVCMTGDGVNDAPALKEADVGIAMGIRGTDVAREASDLVLTDDNFASIVNGLEEGRREYDNIKKFVRYLLSSNIGETVAILFTILLGGPLILLPVQILWINVVTDAVTAIALGLEPPEADLMRRPPRARGEKILERSDMLWVLALGGYIGVVTLALFQAYLVEAPLVVAQTVAFTAMVVFEQVNLFNHRALRSPLATIGFFSNPWLLVALLVTVLLQLAAIYAPFMQGVLHTTALGWREWGMVLLLAVPLFVVPESLKCMGRLRTRGNEVPNKCEW